MNLQIPVPLKMAVLVLGTTLLYTYIGQLVPQKEVHPPVEIAISEDLTAEELVDVGRQIAEGKGICTTCHTIGESGSLRFPDLAGIGTRAGTRIDGVSAVDYMAQSLYFPDSFIVPGFSGGMPVINKPPIGLTEQEIIAVIAWLQSMGSTPTVTLSTTFDAAQRTE